MSRALTTALAALTVTVVAVSTAIQRRMAPKVAVAPTEQRLIQRSVAMANALGIDANTCPMALDSGVDSVVVRFADVSGQTRARLVWHERPERLIHLDHNPNASGHDATSPRDEASARRCAVRWLKVLHVLPDSAPTAIVPAEHTAQHWSFRVTSGEGNLLITIHRQTGEPILIALSAPKGTLTR